VSEGTTAGLNVINLTGGNGNFQYEWKNPGGVVMGNSPSQVSLPGVVPSQVYTIKVSSGSQSVIRSCALQVVKGSCSGSDPDLPGDPDGPGTFDNPLQDDTILEFLARILGVLVQFLVPVIVLFYVITGLMFIMARGNPQKLTVAKTSILYTTIGACIVLGAWILAEMINSTIKQITG